VDKVSRRISFVVLKFSFSYSWTAAEDLHVIQTEDKRHLSVEFLNYVETLCGRLNEHAHNEEDTLPTTVSGPHTDVFIMWLHKTNILKDENRWHGSSESKIRCQCLFCNSNLFSVVCGKNLSASERFAECRLSLTLNLNSQHRRI
jgi:hypothetical protein